MLEAVDTVILVVGFVFYTLLVPYGALCVMKMVEYIPRVALEQVDAVLLVVNLELML